jgi:hypothetical protein
MRCRQCNCGRRRVAGLVQGRFTSRSPKKAPRTASDAAIGDPLASDSYTTWLDRQTPTRPSRDVKIQRQRDVLTYQKELTSANAEPPETDHEGHNVLCEFPPSSTLIATTLRWRPTKRAALNVNFTTSSSDQCWIGPVVLLSLTRFYSSNRGRHGEVLGAMKAGLATRPQPLRSR